MLKAEHRLRANRDFKRVYAQKQSLANRFLVIYLFRREDGDQPRFGFSLSKKVGKAHVRNLYKRRLSELTRAWLPEMIRDIDVVIIARPAITALDFDALAREYRKLLERGGCFAQPTSQRSPRLD